MLHSTQEEGNTHRHEHLIIMTVISLGVLVCFLLKLTKKTFSWITASTSNYQAEEVQARGEGSTENITTGLQTLEAQL